VILKNLHDKKNAIEQYKQESVQKNPPHFLTNHCTGARNLILGHICKRIDAVPL